MINSDIQNIWDSLKTLSAAEVAECVRDRGSEIHSFIGGAGCDVPVIAVLESIEKYGARLASDQHPAMRMGLLLDHEVAVIDRHGQIILIEIKADALSSPASDPSAAGTASPLEPDTYIVMNENTLGIVHTPTSIGVLAGAVLKGGPNPMNGPVPFNPAIDRARPATLADFSEYRVSPRGHLYPI